jgi:putative transposase
MIESGKRSERRACALVGLSRDAYRNPATSSASNTALADAIKEVALQRRRWGYRLIGDYLRPTHRANHKRIWRLYKELGLQVRKRRKKKSGSARVPLVAASAIGQTWSLDFVSDALDSGRRIKCLVVADDYSHECVQLACDFGMGAQYVTRMLDEAARFRGYPKAIRTDNGPEFTARAFMAWCQAHGIEHILIQPGKPMQNGYIESLNDTLRDECLNEHVFMTLKQARGYLAQWRQDYNQIRPHSSCQRMPPALFAAKMRQSQAQAQEQAKHRGDKCDSHSAAHAVGTTRLPTAQGCGQAAMPLPALPPLQAEALCVDGLTPTATAHTPLAPPCCLQDSMQ